MPVPTIMPIIVPVQGLKRKQKLAVEKDMKAESQLTTVEVGCHSKSRRTAEVSIQPTGQEADMLFFRDRRIGFHASIYEGTVP